MLSESIAFLFLINLAYNPAHIWCRSQCFSVLYCSGIQSWRGDPASTKGESFMGISYSQLIPSCMKPGVWWLPFQQRVILHLMLGKIYRYPYMLLGIDTCLCSRPCSVSAKHFWQLCNCAATYNWKTKHIFGHIFKLVCSVYWEF